jgi:primosomal protein N' (replication factor Y)
MTSLFGADAVAGYARIAVERGVDRYPDGLTYAVPATLADLAPGERVVVPLGRGNRLTPGYVVERLEEADVGPASLKPVERRDALGPPLPREMLTLARWISDYYCAPIGMTLAAMLPAAVKRQVGLVQRTMIDLARAGESADHTPTAKQRQVIACLEALPEGERPVELRELQRRAGLGTTGPIKRLVDAGVLRGTHRSTVEAAWAEHAVDDRVPHRLTPAQELVVGEIAAGLDGGFQPHLLFGVTGSGKTEVYLQLIERITEAGRAALMLVPEISLTPQTAGRLIGRFPRDRVAILHSGLTAAQRHQQWSAAATGAASIVIGARSAVFAPIPEGRLGLVIVDEEHDGSYKQDQVPRYHGRDVAVRRAQLAGATIVLGSATPSLESWHNATSRGAYRLHRLAERAPGLTVPRVQVVDVLQERRRRSDRRIHLLGPTLESAMSRTLDAGHQALLLLNRRGYASYITCPDHRCGWLLRCAHCDVTMVFHRRGDLPDGGYVRCHHCLSEQRLPAGCPDCGRRIVTFGFGTQRVEEELAAKFPGLELGRTLLRIDSDTMQRAQDYHAALQRFADRSVHVLVGTQMIAKGLDFPGVRLVGVIDADTAINLPDFRAAERTFQLVSQVSGRCGRGEGAGQVVVQTLSPDAPAIALAANHDYEQFARAELAERGACGLPPIGRMARIVLRDEDPHRARTEARRVHDGLQALAGAEVRIEGPAPCPIARIAGRFREQVELHAPTATELQQVLAAARSEGLLRAGSAMAIDVDPVALM